MTAFRYFRGSVRGWIGCALGALLTLGGIGLAAQPASKDLQGPARGVLLELPSLEMPEPKKNELRLVAVQPPYKAKQPAPDGFTIRVDVPGPETLFRLESEAEMRRRMRQENKGQKLEFPDTRIILSKTPFMERNWDPQEEVVEPYYTAYRRLYFEQINAERYGWDFGYLHPLIALGTFYFDFATLPFQLIAEPCRCYEYNSGYCLPGSPVPLLLYPPHPK